MNRIKNNISDRGYPKLPRISEKQKKHLEYMRSLRPEDWRNTKGRPTKEEDVREYRKQHPDATMYRCYTDLPIAKNTVRKWWASTAPNSDNTNE